MSDMMTQEEAMNMSNEQAVRILIPMRNMMCDQNGYPISDAVFALDKAIGALSADRPQGKWIKRFGSINCSVCKHCSWSESFEHTVRRFKFCPNCGARMDGEA